jgi:hypothetical protein
MRRLTTCMLAAALGLGATGCLMIIGVREPIELSDDRRVVEIDGQLYVIDTEKETIRKIDRATLRDSESTVKTKTD